MQEVAAATRSGMVAIMGADESQVQEVCDAARGNAVLAVGNFNGPGQMVLSGSKAACDRVLIEAERRELRATALSVAGAFHSALMQPAADRMADALTSVAFQSPRVPVLSNVTGMPHEDDGDLIKRRLVQQITQPVQWEKSMRWLLKNSQCRYIELAPGKVLAGLMMRINPKTRVVTHPAPRG